MLALRSAILEHTTATGVHHDWLIEDPTLPDPKAPDARLWTARILPPPTHWAQRRRFTLDVIPPHRRAYLTYQGPVPSNRGRVKQLTTTTCLVTLWSHHHIRLTLLTNQPPLNLHLQRLTNNHWLALTTPCRHPTPSPLTTPTTFNTQPTPH